MSTTTKQTYFLRLLNSLQTVGIILLCWFCTEFTEFWSWFGRPEDSVAISLVVIILLVGEKNWFWVSPPIMLALGLTKGWIELHAWFWPFEKTLSSDVFGSCFGSWIGVVWGSWGRVAIPGEFMFDGLDCWGIFWANGAGWSCGGVLWNKLIDKGWCRLTIQRFTVMTSKKGQPKTWAPSKMIFGIGQ